MPSHDFVGHIHLSYFLEVKFISTFENTLCWYICHLLVMTGHSEAVLSVQFSPDSRHLASGSGDTTVRFWDIYTQTPLFTCSGRILNFIFSHDINLYRWYSLSLFHTSHFKVKLHFSFLLVGCFYCLIILRCLARSRILPVLCSSRKFLIGLLVRLEKLILKCELAEQDIKIGYYASHGRQMANNLWVEAKMEN